MNILRSTIFMTLLCSSNLFAGQGQPPDGCHPPPKDELAAIECVCASCHRSEDKATSSAIPNLYGQNAKYLERELKNFRCETRKARVMNWLTRDLSDLQIADLATWAATKTRGFEHDCVVLEDPNAVNPVEVVPTEPVKQLAHDACLCCHGSDIGPNAIHPKIIGQKGEYLANQLEKFRKGSREGSVMHKIAMHIDEDDEKKTSRKIKQLATYFCQMSAKEFPSDKSVRPKLCTN